MESSEREPSYYEVALTHRQLMVGLVVALTTVVVSFFAGVWIGRGGSGAAPTARVADATGRAAASQVDQITFFGEKPDPARSAAKPAPIAPSPAAPKPAPSPAADSPASASADAESDALRKTLEAEMEANRVDDSEGDPAKPATTSAPAGTRAKRDAAKTPKPGAAAKTAPAAAAAKPAEAPDPAGTFWIQVYSSTNRERANEIMSKLKQGGFGVKLLEPTSGANVRVRVGPYADRAKADRAATRLRREHKLDTWVTDAP